MCGLTLRLLVWDATVPGYVYDDDRSVVVVSMPHSMRTDVLACPSKGISYFRTTDGTLVRAGKHNSTGPI
jgi:hypothetical protein